MVTAQRLRGRLRPLRAREIRAVPAQLGVFEIIGPDGRTELIGQAGGREPFGLRSALASAAASHDGALFRYELTHGYRSRWQELLMLHVADHGELPPGNVDDARLIGRLGQR